MNLTSDQRNWLKANRKVLGGIFEVDFEKLKIALVEAEPGSEESIRVRANARYVRDWILMLKAYDTKRVESKELI